MAARADERKKLERLCRTISRPAVSEARLSLTSGGLVRYALKTPDSDGATHVLFGPMDFIARLGPKLLCPGPLIRSGSYAAPRRCHSRRYDFPMGLIPPLFQAA